MNKKIILSLAIVAAVGAIVVGGTWAYFSVTTISEGNTFSAATMEMQLNGQNINALEVGPALYAKNFYPGAFAQSASVIKNTSGEDSGIAFNPEISLANANDPGHIADYLWLEVWTNGKLWYSNYIKNFPGYGTTNKIVLDTILPGDSQNVAYRILMLETAPNDLQGKEYSVNIAITAHQWNNPDYPVSSATVNPGYVVSGWSYSVCGVRQPNFGYALLATDTYTGRGYDNTKYSPFYSYRVDSPMTDTNSKWMIDNWTGMTSAPIEYPGGKTVYNSSGTPSIYCIVK